MTSMMSQGRCSRCHQDLDFGMVGIDGCDSVKAVVDADVDAGGQTPAKGWKTFPPLPSSWCET